MHNVYDTVTATVVVAAVAAAAAATQCLCHHTSKQPVSVSSPQFSTTIQLPTALQVQLLLPFSLLSLSPPSCSMRDA